MATLTDSKPTWQQYDELRLDREYRYFEAMTKRECPLHGVWHTYEADNCPECSTARGQKEAVA